MKEANRYEVAYATSQHGRVSRPREVTSQRKKKQPYLQWASLRGGTAVKDDKLTPCPLRIQFGKNVLRLRREKGFTQEALAEKVGLSTRYTQSIEAGEYFPALPTLAKLRTALGAS